jgi:RND family efflux transporter MFP subunit
MPACGGESEDVKMLSDDSRDEGIPVVVEKVNIQPFVKNLSFFTRLRGIKETTEGAAIGGRVEKINYKVGSAVKKDDIIIKFPEDAPASMFIPAKTAYENSLKNYDRAKALLEAGETSRANYDGLEAKYLVDKSNYETQSQMLFIKAPFDGTITGLMVNEGDNVKGKDPLFSIANLDKMNCKIWASETEIQNIKKNMPAMIVSDGREYKGKVTSVSLVADAYRRSFYAEVEFDNPRKELKSGVTVSVNIASYSNPEAVIVQRNLIKSDSGGDYLFVEKESIAEKRYLKLGNETDIYFEVLAGLAAGDNLIVKGVSGLTDKVKVNVIE